MTRNIAVLGLDSFNLELFGTIRGFLDYRFHGVLEIDELLRARSYSMPDLLARAEEQILGRSEEEQQEKYRRCLEALPLEISDA